MGRFIANRLLQMIPLIIGITFISFFVMKLAPGNYLDQMRQNPQISAETIDRLSRAFGLDRPWYVQYALWLKNAFTGNFGFSFTYKLPVFSLIGQYLLATLLLSITSLVISWIIGLPLGVLAATRKNGAIDKFASLLAFTFISTPGFFMALLALMFALKTGWFPVGDMTNENHSSMTAGGKFADIARHLILPALVLGTRNVATIVRQMRGNLLDVLGENYILAARARGLAEKKVIFKHAVRNAINPLITIFGYQISGLLAGAALVEAVMNWPGLGKLLLDAVISRDLFVAMASFVIGGVMLIIGNLIADILLAITDPRIRVS